MLMVVSLEHKDKASPYFFTGLFFKFFFLSTIIACVAADAVTVLLMRRSILTEKVARRGVHLTREYSVDPLELVRVSEVMDRDPATVPSAMKVSALADRIARGDKRLAHHQGFPIVDRKGNLVGIITWGDITQAVAKGIADDKTVLEAGSDSLVVEYPDELVHEAVMKMLHHDIGRLPVVDRHEPRKLVGYLGRSAIMEARLHRLHEERVREPGWLTAAIPSLVKKEPPAIVRSNDKRPKTSKQSAKNK